MIFLVFHLSFRLILFYSLSSIVVANAALINKSQLGNKNKYDISRTLIDFYTLQSDDKILNPHCEKHAKRYFEDLKVVKPWALHMIDASSKLQPGILIGNLIEFGNFDECLVIHNDENSSDIINGKYCTISIVPNNYTTRQILPALQLPPERFANMSLRTTYGITWSVCIPDSCTLSDIYKYYKNVIPKLLSMDGILIQPNNGSCYTMEDYRMKLRKSDWVTIVILITLVILIILSTTYDYACQILNVEKTNKMLKYFSLYENTISLMTVGHGGGGNGPDMRVLNGLRFLSASWVIFHHRFLLRLFSANINTVDIQNWMRQYHSMVIMGSSFSVDTFFTISGMLVLISFFKSMDKENKLNLFRYYLHRYLRLTPSMALVALFYATLLKYLFSGPMWLTGVDGLASPCRNYWWATLLYIQNYVNSETYCVVQTWYLSVDMQLFWLSPLFLIPLYRKPAIGLTLIILMIFIPMGISFYLAWIHHYTGGHLYQKDILSTHYFVRYYTATHVRASPWFIGLLLGYIIYKTRNHKLQINAGLVGLLWLASFLILIIDVFGIYPFEQYEYQLNRLRSSSYLAFSRTAWSLAIAWIIFASVHGYGGLINKFLSCSVFTVMNKWGYSVYITHLGMQFALAASEKTPEYYTLFKEVYYSFADTGIAVLMGYILTVGFEMPIFKIEDYFFNKMHQAGKK